MNQLVNAFSVLEVDIAVDGKLAETDVPTVQHENSDERGKDKKKGDSLGEMIISKNDNGYQQSLEIVSGDSSGEIIVSKNDNGYQQSLEIVSGEYKLPLIWIDLEMTGLNVEVDRILEIACVVTDGRLSKSIEGPDLVIYQSKECLDKMGEWCQTHHAASGLTEKVLRSTIGEQEAEKQVIEFVKKYVGTYTPLLAGNSVYMDFLFLKKYMPDLASLFHHVIVDVSSVRALCIRWYPKESKKAPSKEKKHRAINDIRESIAELKYLKENIFKSSKHKK